MSKDIRLLINQCKRFNRRAQIQVYDMYCEAMFAVSCRYLDEESAKDAMQEAFLKSFLKIDQYKEKVTFGAWLKRIVINQCIDELKKKKIEVISMEDHSIEILDEDDWYFDSNITKERILKAIDLLSDKYKTVIRLYLVEGYNHSEISEIIGIPIKTSRTQLRRGKLHLRELLKDKK